MRKFKGGVLASLGDLQEARDMDAIGKCDPHLESERSGTRSGIQGAGLFRADPCRGAEGLLLELEAGGGTTQTPVAVETWIGAPRATHPARRWRRHHCCGRPGVGGGAGFESGFAV